MHTFDAFKFAGGKQGAGVVGKICTVAIFAFIALAIGLYSMPGGTEKAVAVLVGMGIVATLLVWLVRQLLKYAENHR